MPWRDEPSWVRRWTYRLLPLGAALTVVSFALAGYLVISTVERNARTRSQTCGMLDQFIKSNIVYRDGIAVGAESSLTARARAIHTTGDVLRDFKRRPVARGEVLIRYLRSQRQLQLRLLQEQQESVDRSERAVRRWTTFAIALECGRKVP